jgi:hypothetical protein
VGCVLPLSWLYEPFPPIPCHKGRGSYELHA